MASPGEEIENPVSGERIVFIETRRETKGDLLAFDYTLKMGGSVPFAHVHPNQEERFVIASGRARIRVGKSIVAVGAGETTVVPPGTVHRLWNDDGEELRAVVEFRPALRIEEAFEQLFALARQGKLVAFGLPGPLRAAVMAQEFEDEVRLAGLPPALQKFAASLLAPVGRLLGYGGRSL